MGNIKTLKVKMALTSRLAYHTCMLRPHGGMKLVLPSSTMSSIKSISPQEHQISREEFWEKNKRLSRPLSPHLTIYKPQMTSMLSITHRGTGVAWSLVLSGVGIGYLQSSDFSNWAGCSPKLTDWSSFDLYCKIWFILDGLLSYHKWIETFGLGFGIRF